MNTDLNIIDLLKLGQVAHEAFGETDETEVHRIQTVFEILSPKPMVIGFVEFEVISQEQFLSALSHPFTEGKAHKNFLNWLNKQQGRMVTITRNRYGGILVVCFDEFPLGVIPERLPEERLTYTLHMHPEAKTRSYSTAEKSKLRPIAETLAMLDGNAFFGIETNEEGDDIWWEQYLPEAWSLYQANGGSVAPTREAIGA